MLTPNSNPLLKLSLKKSNKVQNCHFVFVVFAVSCLYIYICFE